MKELEECLELRREIIKVDERISELKVITPKNQVITGMPRGGNTVNTADRYLVRLENLNTKRDAMELRLNSKWGRVKRALKEAEIRNEHIFMLKVRFYFGKDWNTCANIMAEKFGVEKWNTNKCFRVFRATLRKLKDKTA